MPERYFARFPVIRYGNNNVIDITRRVAITETFSKSPYAFYPYELKFGQTPEVIANEYYGDYYYSWLVFLANKIVDPYYDWKLDYNAFNDFIIEKYGSVELAQQTTKFYRVNWYLDDSVITTSTYENLLPQNKKYWEPQFDEVGRIVAYHRKPVDWLSATNKIVKINLGDTSDVTAGDVLFFSYMGDTGTAEVAQVFSSTQVYLHHLDYSGFALSSGAAWHNFQRTASGTVVGSFSQTFEAIDATEFAYWHKVSVYDYEEERNQGHNIIRLLGLAQVENAVEELKRALK